MVRVCIAFGVNPGEIRAAVLGLAAISLVQMRARAFPLLYTSGIRYEREPRGSEVWQTAAQTLERLRGDCEDLASYRVAELHRLGELQATIICRPIHADLFHILVRRANGTIEDPSKILGM